MRNLILQLAVAVTTAALALQHRLTPQPALATARHRRRGADIVEYALLAGLAVLLLIGLKVWLGDAIANLGNRVTTFINGG